MKKGRVVIGQLEGTTMMTGSLGGMVRIQSLRSLPTGLEDC